MALIVRMVSAAGSKVVEKRLKTGLNKLVVPEGAHVEVIDQATGMQVEGVRSVDANGNSVLSFAGSKGEVSLALDGSVGSYLPLFSDASFADDVAVSAVSGSSTAGEDRDGGRSATPILLGILGLGALGGLAAAAGGGGGTPKDTAAPVAPSGLDLATVDDSGSLTTDNLTKNNSALTITGAAEAGARVELFDGATSLGSATADATGNFSVDVSLASGVHAITAKATDAAGNVSGASTALSVTVDVAAPTAAIAMSDKALVVGETSLVTITFSEAVVDFSNADLTVQSGTLSNVATTDGGVTWTATFTPTVAVNVATNVISLAATYADAAGNAGAVATGPNYTVNTVTFDVAESPAAVPGGNPIVSLGGNATGPVTITLNAGDQAVFSREGQTAPTVVSAISTKTLQVPAGGTINLVIDGAATTDVFTIDAPNAATLVLTGNGGAGSDTISVVVESATANPDLRTMTLNTSGLTGVEAIKFVFPTDARDVVKLTADTVLTGFSQIEVSKGGVDLTSVQVAPGTEFIVNSTLIMTLDQFKQMTSLVSITGLGKLTINLTAAEVQSGALDAFLGDANASKPILIGTAVTVVDTSNNGILAAPAALDSISFDGIPGLSASIDDLQAQIDALDLAGNSATTQITSIAAHIAVLESALTALASDVSSRSLAQSTALANLQTAFAAANTALGARIDSLASAVHTEIVGLQSQITANGVDIATLAGRATSLSATLAALTTTVSGNNTAQTAALAAAKTALDAAISALGARLDADIADLQGQIDTNGTDIAALADRATALETAVTRLDGAANVTGSVKQQIAAAKTALETTISALATRLDADIADLQGQIDTNGTDIAALADRATALETAVTRLDGAVGVAGSVKQQIAAAKTALETTISDLATRLDADIADLQGQIDTNGTDIAALADRATALETAVTRLDGAVGVAGSVKQQIAAAKTALEGTIDALGARLDSDIAYLQLQIDMQGNDETLTDPATLNSIAGLKAAVVALQTLVGGTSVSAQLAERIGHESDASADPVVTATGLFGDIERLILAASTALQHQIDVLKDDASGNVPATLDSIAGLHAAIDALRNGTNLGDAEDPNSLAGKLAGLQSQIDTLSNGLDTAHPTIVDVHLASGTGADYLGDFNAGDVITATVKFSEVVVTTGTPVLSLQIGDGLGARIVGATLTGGAGTDTLTFSYTITPDLTDLNGISLPSNSLIDGTIKDLSGNAAVRTYDAVSSNIDFQVNNAPLIGTVSAHLLFEGAWVDQNLSAETNGNDIWVADLYTYDGDLAADFPNGLANLTQADLLRLVSNATRSGTVLTSDLTPLDEYVVPAGMFALTEYAWNLQDQGDVGNLPSNRLVPTGSVLAAGQVLDLSDAQLVNLFGDTNDGSYYALLSRAELADLELINPTAAQLVDLMTDASLNQDVLQMITVGRNPSDIILTITTPLTVAQAASLAAAGFDLEHNITYSIRDSYATVQAAMADPNQAHALLDAQQVIATGDELSNAVAMTAMTASVNLRTELGDGNDTINASRANEQIVGQQGGDTINLTYKDGSTDAIVYQSVYDGRTSTVLQVGFSSNSLEYRTGSVLEVTVNGVEYTYTTDYNQAPQTALQNLADVVMANQVTGRAMIGLLYQIDRTGNFASSQSVYSDQMVDGAYKVPAGKFFLTMTDFFNILAGQTPFQQGAISPMDLILMGYRGGQTFALSDEKYYSVNDGWNFDGQTILAAEDSLFNYFNGFSEQSYSDAWNNVHAAERQHDIAALLVDGEHGTLTFVGTPATSLDVHAGSVQAYPINNNGELTVATAEFAWWDGAYAAPTNPGHTTVFDRELRVTIDGLTVTANIVAGNAEASVAALRDAVVAAMAEGATSAISAAKSTMTAEASLGMNDAVTSYSGTVTVNGVAYAIGAGATTVGEIVDRIASISGIHSVDIVNGAIVITEEVHGSDAAANTLSANLVIDGNTLTQEQTLAQGHSLYNEIGNVQQNGTELTFTGRFLPGTDAYAPTFNIDSAEIDYAGTQQETRVDYSANNADYYAGGKLYVTIAGHQISADMVANDAAASMQNLVDAIDGFRTPTYVKLDAGGVSGAVDRGGRAIAIGNTGDYVVTWSGDDGTGDVSVYFQKFDSSGQLVGAAVRLEGAAGIGNTTNYEQPNADDHMSIASVGATGEFVVAYHGGNSSGEKAVFVQKFHSDGTPSSTRVELNGDNFGGGYDWWPKVTALGSDGAFAVVWDGASSTQIWNAFVQIFDPSGTPVGSQIKLDAVPQLGEDYDPEIAATGSDGSFAVTWATFVDGHLATAVQSFDATGVATSDAQVLNVGTGLNPFPQIAAIGNSGAYAVTWFGGDPSDLSVFVQTFGPGTSGQKVMLEATGIVDGQDSYPTISALGSSGQFAVTYFGFDGTDSSIYVAKFDATGSQVGEQIKIEPLGVDVNSDEFPTISAIGALGEFAVAWTGRDAVGNWQSYVQKFDANGSAAGAPVQLDVGSTDDHAIDNRPEITAIGTSGAFVVTWSGIDPDGGTSTYVQQFDANGDMIAPFAPLVEGAAVVGGHSIIISASTEQPDPLHVTNATQDYIGEQQQATATLDTVTHYNSYTYDLADGVTPNRTADVYFQGGKAHMTFTPVDAQGVEGTPVTVSADMATAPLNTQFISGIYNGAAGGDGITVYQTVQFQQGTETYRVQFFATDEAGDPSPGATYGFSKAAKLVGGTWVEYAGATQDAKLAALAHDLGAASVYVDAAYSGNNAAIMIFDLSQDVTNVEQVKFTTDSTPGNRTAESMNPDIALTTGTNDDRLPIPSVSTMPGEGVYYSAEATTQALVDAVNAAAHQTVHFVFSGMPELTLGTELNTVDGLSEKFKVAVTVNGTLPAGLDTEVLGGDVAGGNTIGSMIDYLNTVYAGLGTWSLNAAHTGLDFVVARDAVVGFDPSKASLGEAVHIKLIEGEFSDAQATTTAALLPFGVTAAIDANAPTKIVVTADAYAKESFHIASTLDYQGIKQIATVHLDGNTTYGNDFVDGGTVDASGQAHVNRAANVYYDGGKAYLTITPVNPDGSDGTAVTVSADMVKQGATALLDYPPLVGNENGIWVGSWGTDLFDIAVQVGATTYTEADFASYLAGLSPAKTMVENPYFDATGKATITDFINWLDSLPHVTAAVTQAGILLTSDGTVDLAITAFKANFYDSPTGAAGPNMGNVHNTAAVDYPEATAQALVAAINAAAAHGGTLEGVVGSAALVNGNITLMAADYGKEMFHVSDVALDYQGIKQIATVSLDSDTTYTTGFTDGATAGDNTDRGAGVYYSGGKAYLTITPVNADGTDGTPITVSADMADTNSIWFGFPQAPFALESTARIIPFTGALETMTIDVTVDGTTHTRAEFETWLATLDPQHFIHDPYHTNAQTATAADLASWIATLPGISSATFDGFGYQITPTAGHTVHMAAYAFGISSQVIPDYWVYAQQEYSGAERAAQTTAQNLVDAINAQTGVGGSLHGVIGSAALVDGQITMTADHVGELTFKVSDVALDYQGIHQIATADYSTNDADYYSNQTNGTGTVSIDIDTTPGVEGGVVHVAVDMVEDDATQSLQNLVDEIRHLANDAIDPATAAAATVAGTFASGDTNAGALDSGFYVTAWSVTVGGTTYSGSGYATTETVDNPTYDPNPTITTSTWTSTGTGESSFANVGAFLTYLSGLAGVDTATIDANGDIVVTTVATGADAHVNVTVSAFTDASDSESTSLVSAGVSGDGSAAVYGALHGFVSDATLSNGTVTVVSQDATHEQFSLTDADITDRPEYQQASAHFSNNDADYFAGGKIGLTINGETIEVAMVAGDAAATVSALADAVAAKNAQTAAQVVIDLPTDILATDLTGNRYVTATYTPYESGNASTISLGMGPSGDDDTIAGMLLDIAALPGVASAQLVAGNIVITADPGVHDLIIHIATAAATGAYAALLSDTQSWQEFTLRDSQFSGDLKDVSVDGTNITVTAAHDVDGYGEINITDVHTGVAAQQQVTEILLGNVGFENGIVGNDGKTTVSIDVAGHTITAETGTSDADTVRNLAQAIIEARDGVYDRTEQTGSLYNAAAVVRIDLPAGVDGSSLLVGDGNGHSTFVNVTINFGRIGASSYTFGFEDAVTGEQSLANYVMSLNEALSAFETDNNVPAGRGGTISYDAVNNQIVITSDGMGGDYSVNVNAFNISQFWSHDALQTRDLEGNYVPAALDFSTPVAVTGGGGLRIDLNTNDFFNYAPGSGDVTLFGLDNSWTYKPLIGSYSVQMSGPPQNYNMGYAIFALNLHFEAGGTGYDFSQTSWIGEDLHSADANSDGVVDLRDYVLYMNNALTAWEGATGGPGDVATVSMDGNGDIIVTANAGATVTMPEYGAGTTGAFVLQTYDNGNDHLTWADSGMLPTLGEDGVTTIAGSNPSVTIGMPIGVSGYDLVAAGTAVTVNIDFVSGSTPYHFSVDTSLINATSVIDLVTQLNDALTFFETQNSVSLGTFSFNDITNEIHLDTLGATSSVDVNAFTVPGFVDDYVSTVTGLTTVATTDYNPVVTIVSDIAGTNAISTFDRLTVDVAFVTGGQSYNFTYSDIARASATIADLITTLNAELTSFENTHHVEMGTFLYDGVAHAIKLSSSGSNTSLINVNQFSITSQYGTLIAGARPAELAANAYDSGETTLLIDGAADLTTATRISADVLHFSLTINGTLNNYTYTPPLKEAESDPGATVGGLMNFISNQLGVKSVEIVNGNIVITPNDIEPGVAGSISGTLAFDTLGTPLSAETGWLSPVGADAGASVTLGAFAHLTGAEHLVAGPISFYIVVGDGEGTHLVSGTYTAAAGDTVNDLLTFMQSTAGEYATVSLTDAGITVASTGASNGQGGHYTDLHVGNFSFAYELGQGYNVVQSVSDALGTVDYNGNQTITLTAHDTGLDPLNVGNFDYQVTDTVNSDYQKIYISFPNDTLDTAVNGMIVSVHILGVDSSITIDRSLAYNSGWTAIGGQTGVIGVDGLLPAQRSEAIVAMLVRQILADHPHDDLGNVLQGRITYDVDGNPDLQATTGSNANVIMFEANRYGADVLGAVDNEAAIHTRVTVPNQADLQNPITMFYSAATGQIQQGSLWFTSGSGGDETINDQTTEGNAQTGRDQGVLSYDDSAAGAANATDYTFTVGGTTQSLPSMDEFSGKLDINDEVRAGDSTDYLNQGWLNPVDRSTYYGNSAITGVGEDGSLLGIDQNFTNPTDGRNNGSVTNGNATYAGDSALTGFNGEDGTLLGIDQNYLNPGSGRGEDANGDVTYYGDAASSGTSGVQQTVANTNGSYTAIGTSPATNTGNVSTGTDALYGAAPGHYGDLGLYTDHVDGTQTVSGESYYPIDKIDMQSWTDGGYSGSDGYYTWTNQDGFAAFTWDRTWTDIQATGNPTADVINNFQVDANNNGVYSHDTIAIEGALAASTVIGPVDIVSGAYWHPLFDLDTNEFGIVSQWDNRNAYDPVTTSNIDNADAIARLLDENFWMVSWGEDTTLNTSIFAVTASNDFTETAIWAHQQSTPWDNTVDANELTLLAIVHTTGGEFNYNNFEVMGLNNNAPI